MAPVANPVGGVGGTSIIGAAGCCPFGTSCLGFCALGVCIGVGCVGIRDEPGPTPPGVPACPPGQAFCVATGRCVVNLFTDCPGFGGPGPPQFPPGPGPTPQPPQFPPPTNGQRGGCPPRGAAPAKILCPPGCHANKAGYHLKNGTFVQEGSRCVTNRRRNPLNPRALDRAAGRLRSAQKAVRFLQAAKLPRKRRR